MPWPLPEVFDQDPNHTTHHNELHTWGNKYDHLATPSEGDAQVWDGEKYSPKRMPTTPSWMSDLGEEDGLIWTDEFDDGDIDEDYVEVTPSGTTEWVEARGVLSALTYSQTAGHACGILYPRGLAVGETIETCMRMFSPYSNYLMSGLILSNGATTGSAIVYAMPYIGGTNGAGTVTTSTRGGTFLSVTTPQTANINAGGAYSLGLFQRVTRIDTSLWLTEYSPNGVHWSAVGQGALSRTLEPTHIGLAVTVWGGGAIERIASFEYLRVYQI